MEKIPGDASKGNVVIDLKDDISAVVRIQPRDFNHSKDLAVSLGKDMQANPIGLSHTEPIFFLRGRVLIWAY